MDYMVIIKYSTDNEEINESITNLLDSSLPYMVDNVNVVLVKN